QWLPAAELAGRGGHGGPERGRVSGRRRCAGQVHILCPTAGPTSDGGHPLGPGCFSCARECGARNAVRVLRRRGLTLVRARCPVLLVWFCDWLLLVPAAGRPVIGHGWPPIPSRPPARPRAPRAHPRPLAAVARAVGGGPGRRRGRRGRRAPRGASAGRRGSESARGRAAAPPAPARGTPAPRRPPGRSGLPRAVKRLLGGASVAGD